MNELREAVGVGEAARLADLLARPDVLAQLRASEEGGRALLFDGLKRGHTDVVLKLLTVANAFHLHATDAGGKTVLHEACLQGNTLVAIRLLALASELTVVRDHKGYTPLHYAAFLGHAELVTHLVQHGAELDVRGLDGCTPLHHAAKNGHARTAMCLLRAGADASLKIKGNGAEHGKTAAEMAHAQGFVHIEKLFSDAHKPAAQHLATNMAPSHSAFKASAPRPVAAPGADVRVLTRRLLRLEREQGRIEALQAELQQLRGDVRSGHNEAQTRLRDVTATLAQIAPGNMLNEERGTWQDVLAMCAASERAQETLRARLGEVETRLRYLEYLLLAVLVVYVLF